MSAALTLSPEFSARVAREAAAAGFATPEAYLAAAVADRAADPPGSAEPSDAAPAGRAETIDTPRGPVNAHGPVPEGQRAAFVGMLADRLEGPAIPWEEASEWILERLRARQRARGVAASGAAGDEVSEPVEPHRPVAA